MYYLLCFVFVFLNYKKKDAIIIYLSKYRFLSKKLDNSLLMLLFFRYYFTQQSIRLNIKLKS